MRRTAVRRVLVVLGGAVAAVLLTPALASAHPLGNFTVNSYAGLSVGADRVDVDYVVDMAEIPTFQARPDIDRNGDGDIARAEAARYAQTRCSEMAKGLRLVVDDATAVLHSGASEATLPVGQAGLATLRLECQYDAVVTPADSHTLSFANRNLADRVGWHEITAVGAGARLRGSDVPSRSLSARLTQYPADRLQSPPDVRTASLDFRPGGTAASAPPATIHTPTGSVVRGFDELTQSFTSAVAARDLTVGLALVALAIGVGLGAIHAFAPGHGKTVMAAYLVGERGTVRDGLLIGVTVAATHTVGVLALGGVLTASQEFAPESLYPYLSLASGVCFVALGTTLLWRAYQRRGLGLALAGHHHHAWGHSHAEPDHDHDHGHHEHAHPAHDDHDHAHDHDHDHAHDHDHDHAHDDDHAHDHDHAPSSRPSRRSLVTLGFVGGMVPTPTAVVVLLGATAIGRAWFGALLVVAYGLGMAATLVAAGVLLARARRRFDLKTRSERAMRIAMLIPIVTALVVIGSGLLLVVRAAASV